MNDEKEKVPEGVSVQGVKKVINLAIRVQNADGEGKDRIFAYGVEADSEMEAKQKLAFQLGKVVEHLQADIEKYETGTPCKG